MQIYTLCDDNEREEILNSISNHFQSEDVVYITCENDIEDHDLPIVISHKSICLTKSIDLTNYPNVYIYFSKMLVLTQEESNLVKLRQEALAKGDWQRAKSINDLLIDINFIRKNESVSSMPDYLQIETTSFCNAKCIMCSHYFSNNKGASHLGSITVNNMEDAIQLSRTISLNGMGEPFVSPHLSDQIDYYSKYGNRIVTNTNLSVINQRLIDQINEHFDWIEISCDGATKETYESIRKNLSFEAFKNNLLILKEKCPNVRKHIATVVMRQNVEEMPLLVELASWAGASIITFMTLNSNIIINNQKDEMCNYPRVLQYYSVQALKRGKELGIPVIVPNMHLLNQDIAYDDIRDELEVMSKMPLFKDKVETEKMIKTSSIVDEYLSTHDEIQRDTKPSKVKCSGICDWILKQSYIDLQGNVAMCCRNQSFHAGNVNKTRNFVEVWNSPLYKKLRGIFYSGYIPESCLKCGLIESKNLKFLKVDINDDFYVDAEYKQRQKETLRSLLGEDKCLEQ